MRVPSAIPDHQMIRVSTMKLFSFGLLFICNVAAAFAGTGILYTRTVGSHMIIFTSDTTFTNPVQLTSSDSVCYGARWSPDGSRIVFVVQSSSGQDLWLMNADGSQKRRLTFWGSNVGAAPCWHNDGNRIIYEQGGTIYQQTIRIINADGTNDQVLFVHNPGGSINKNENPFMNPANSNEVLYTYDNTNFNPNRAILIRRLSAGTDTIVYPQNGKTDNYPQFSNNGRFILFTESAISYYGHSDLKILDRQTGLTRPLCWCQC
jgi:Tol biopolymer transport system component